MTSQPISIDARGETRRRSRWRVALAGTATVALAVAVAACGSGKVSAAQTTTTLAPPASSTTAVPVTTASTNALPSPTTTRAVTAASTTSTSAPSSACAALAAHTFVHINTVAAGPDDRLDIVGNPATLVCGGPDDSHFDVDTTHTVSGEVLPDASVEVFPVGAMGLQHIANTQLATYLASDDDTRTFLVTGPLSDISALQEQYHP